MLRDLKNAKRSALQTHAIATHGYLNYTTAETQS